MKPELLMIKADRSWSLGFGARTVLAMMRTSFSFCLNTGKQKGSNLLLKNLDGSCKNWIFMITIFACDKPCLVCSSSKQGTGLGRFNVTTGFGYSLHFFLVDITGYLLIHIRTLFSSRFFLLLFHL